METSELEKTLKRVLSNKHTKKYFNAKGIPFLLVETSEHGGYNDVYCLMISKRGRNPKLILERWDYHVLREHPAVKEIKPEETTVIKPEQLGNYFSQEELKEIMTKAKNFQDIIKVYFP